MNHITRLIFIGFSWLYFGSTGLHAQYEPKNIDEQEILTTFANYKSGFEQFKAEMVIRQLSASSVRFFDTLLYHIQHSDSVAVSSLPVSKMILVLDVRKKAYAKAAEVHDVKGLLDIMLNYGVIREDQELQIADIMIKDTVAYCAALMPGSPASKDYIFIKEQDYWKLDLQSQFNESDKNYNDLVNNEDLMKKYGLTRASLFRQICDKFGIPPGRSQVWEAVISQGE